MKIVVSRRFYPTHVDFFPDFDCAPHLHLFATRVVHSGIGDLRWDQGLRDVGEGVTGDTVGRGGVRGAFVGGGRVRWRRGRCVEVRGRNPD